MTGELFLTLLNRSITAGWLVLAVLALRLLFRRAPKAFFAALWVLVGIRLLSPFSFESRFSLLRTAEPVSEELFSSGFPAGKETLPGVPGSVTEQPPALEAPDAFGKTEGVQGKPAQSDGNAAGADGNGVSGQEGNRTHSFSVLEAVSAVWLAGMAGMLVYGALSYRRIARRVKESAPLAGKVRLCDGIGSPFILGIFRPRIYLPSDLNETDRGYVLAHETAHLKRGDHIWKPLGFLLLSVYWFHPLLWVSYCLLCRDIELACDEKVIKGMGTESRKSYSTALINCSIPRRMLAACPLAFGEVSVKRRITSVLHYKKPAFWIIIAAAVAFLGLGIAFLSNPNEKQTEITTGDDEKQPTITAGDNEKQTAITAGDKTLYLPERNVAVDRESGFGIAFEPVYSRESFSRYNEPVYSIEDYSHYNIYSSADGGKNWNLATEDFIIENAEIEQIYFQEQNTVFCCFGIKDGTKIYLMSKDGGVTWLSDYQFAYDETSGQDIIDWKDDALEEAMRRITGITDRPITWRDVGYIAELDLSGNGITDVSALAGLTNLRTLKLSDNGASHFRKLELSTLEGLTSLTTLDLSNNGLTTADLGALPPLTSLTTLNLGKNLLTDVECLAVSRFPALTTLDVSENELTGAGGLGQLLGLTSLDVSQNKLFTADGVSDLKKLVRLNLSGNRSLDLKELSGLTRLFSLDLSRNEELDLSGLPELAELTELDLSFNGLTDISSLSRLPKLTSLELSYNKPADLSVLSGLKELKELHLSGNGMTDANALSGFTKLTKLDLNDNALTDISGLSKLTNLEDLALSFNEQADFSSLSGLTKLTCLYLMGNGLTDISFLSGLTGLTELSLCDNGLTDIESLSELKNLRILLLAGNKLTDISALSGLTKLTWLSLSDNEITEVDSLAGLTELSTLTLERNRIEDVSALSGLTDTKLWLDGNDIKVWQK